MAIVRNADAEWKGDLKSGNGSLKVGSGSFSGPYSFKSRFESGTETNPEELLGAAHAACYSMALSHGLASAGHTPTSVKTVAKVSLEPKDGGFWIPQIELVCEAVVPGLSNADFQKAAEATKAGCPISKALAATRIVLSATLKS